MKNVIKIMKDYSFGFVLGVLLFGVVGVYAATRIYASSISIDTTDISELSSGATLDTAITSLYEKTNSTDCPEDYLCYEKFTPQIGDYVKMTPTLTSFTTSSTYTGYTSQTINPSKLNLWRVIRINDDDTIDMVSEYVSSTAVYFQGQKGYKNFVGYLNLLASKYENRKYTVGSRYMGYNGQTEYLTDTANTVDSTKTSPPWYSSTGGSSVESKGGGDTLYQTDINLVTNAIGNLKAYKVDTTTVSEYWLASRDYYYAASTYWMYRIRSINTSGTVTQNKPLYGYSSEFTSNSYSNYLRPIVTVKPYVYGLSGSGTSSDPWVLPRK